jgi:hypothetical protein
MILASMARADDAAMTKLIVGVWTYDCTLAKIEYKADGTVVFNSDGKDIVEKWHVEDGALFQTDDSLGRMTVFKILFLTEHEWLTLGITVHAKGYSFYRKDDRDN